MLSLVAGSVLAYVSQAAGEDAALKERGRWANAKVVAIDDGGGKTYRCTLQKPNGAEIKPVLTEQDGCGEGM